MAIVVVKVEVMLASSWRLAPNVTHRKVLYVFMLVYCLSLALQMCCVMLTLEDEHRAFKEINNYPVPLVVNLVRSLMYSDPAKRPTATMALQILNDLHV